MYKKFHNVMFTLIASMSCLQAQPIHIASEVSYPPWNDEEDGQYVGYEVDLFPLICEKAQLKCDFNSQQFSSIISSIRFKKYDIIMSGMGITPHRKRVIDFSRPYGKLPSVFAVKKGVSLTFCTECGTKIDLENSSDEEKLISSIVKDIGDKKIGVQKNSLSHTFFTEHGKLKKKANIVVVETQKALIDKLETGQIDALLSTKSYVIGMIKNSQRKIEILGPDITGGMMGNGVGIGIRKGDKALKKKLDNAINELEREGVLSELTTKWFGFDMFTN